MTDTRGGVSTRNRTLDKTTECDNSIGTPVAKEGSRELRKSPVPQITTVTQTVKVVNEKNLIVAQTVVVDPQLHRAIV